MKIEINNDLFLEMIEEKHSQEIFELVSLNKNYLSEWLPWVDNMHDVDFIKTFIRGSVQRSSDGNEFAFVIIYNNKIVGRIGIYKIENQNKIGEIGYWITKSLQGKGLVSISCINIINYCFKQLNLNRIEIKCASENFKSQAIPERLDFKYEGTLRQAELVHDKFIDLNLYSMLKENWIKRI